MAVPLALVAASGVLMLLFALHARDPSSGASGTVIVPPAINVAQPVPQSAPEAELDLILTQVTMDGSRSSAEFQLADSTTRAVMLGQELRPGWRLKDVKSGSVTFATANGELRFALSSIPGDTGQEGLAGKAQPKSILIPDAPAVAADGSAVTRCSEPEC
jgi:hypothetical protein